MITGFILVSVLCVSGGNKAATIAGVPVDKVLCNANTMTMFKTKEECEKVADHGKACAAVDSLNIIIPSEGL